MTEQKHTPEPWFFGWAGFGQDGIAEINDINLNPVFEVKTCSEEQIESVRRSVICVNACQGINPKAVPDLLKVVKEFLLCNPRQNLMGGNDYVIDLAEAAIAKVKGGTNDGIRTDQKQTA